MDVTPYTAPEILDASRGHRQKDLTTTSKVDNPVDTRTTTTVSTNGNVTKTTITTKSSVTITSSHLSTELAAAPSMDMWSLGQIVYEMHTNGTMFTSADDAFTRLTSEIEHQKCDSDGDLDVATGVDGMRQIPQDERLKIERIEDRGTREVITGLLQIQPERRVDSEAVRNLYLDVKE
ncbi:hypothetical protein B0O80DRAFT_445467 [Mortierella sp. GBAus27b]|nr:hypothetical protein B0O80DRAFT_445467 [Mortierella sp. GBAus27b]